MQAPCRHRHLRRILYLCAGRDFNDTVLVATIQNETAWGLSVVLELTPFWVPITEVLFQNHLNYDFFFFIALL